MTIDPAVLSEIEALKTQSAGGLRTKYFQLFGHPSRSSSKQFLFRRIAWRLQARAEGDLSTRARRRAAEIADEADLRLRAPKGFLTDLETPDHQPPAPRRRVWDGRLPPAGTLLTRTYRGQSIEVRVLDDGFEYQSRRYRSLSAIAREVTGTRWNGLLFFHLTERHHG